MLMWWREKIWKEHCNVRWFKPWCCLCQKQLISFHAGVHRARKLRSIGIGREALRRVAVAGEKAVCRSCRKRRNRVVRLRAQVAELQGRAEMSITSVIPADAMPRGGVLNVGGRPSDRSPGSPEHGRPQSGCPVEFDVDQGRRAHG